MRRGDLKIIKDENMAIDLVDTFFSESKRLYKRCVFPSGPREARSEF